MSAKKAFIFDTNFIIQNKQLDEVVKNLENNFVVYISQISIDERIAQQCRELRKTREEIEKYKKQQLLFVDIKFNKTYDEACAIYKKSIQKKYDSLFGKRIIPFAKNARSFDWVIERSNKRLPPFLDEQNASDKGFKDSLLWYSIINYFKYSGEEEVIFVSDDSKAFLKHKTFLENEFNTETNKSIVIKKNSFYRELISSKKGDEVVQESLTIPNNIDALRQKIFVVINALCGIDEIDYFGNEIWNLTFITHVKFDSSYIKAMFEGLNDTLSNHIFEQSIPASRCLDLDGRIKDQECCIPMINLEKARNLYFEIQKTCPQYMEQFLNAASQILNNNYREIILAEDDDLPF